MPRNKRRRAWLDYLVYLAVRLIVACAQTLTLATILCTGTSSLAWLMYKVDARHRAVGIENLRAGLRR